MELDSTGRFEQDAQDINSLGDAGAGDVSACDTATQPSTARGSADNHDRLQQFTEQIAHGLAVCWSSALNDVTRSIAADHNTLRTVVTDLRTVFGKVSSLCNEVESVHESASSLGGCQEDLCARFNDVEQRLVRTDEATSRLEEGFRLANESHTEIRKTLDIQSAATANLEQALASQIGLIETRVMTAISQIGERVAELSKVLTVHTEVITELGSALSRIDERQQFAEKRLDQQADAIRTVHRAMQAQSARWGAFTLAATKLREAVGGSTEDQVAVEEAHLRTL